VSPLLFALGLSAAGALLVLATGQGTRAGALAGFAVAALVTTGLGVAAFAPLAVFVLGSGALTRLGRAAKEARGIGEANQGRRGAAHVAAKLALPALCGALAVLRVGPPGLAALVATTAMCGAFADTAATELGPLARGKVYGLEGGKVLPLAHGASGGVSFAGLLAALLASAAVAVSAWIPGLVRSANGAAAAAGAGFAASLVESLVARSALGGWLGHHGRNAAVSALSAAGVLAARWIGWIGT
jgi:uncharacterized membrane protein